MAKRGRVGKYNDWITPDGLQLIEGWARDGLTEKQIANKKIGISETTFCDWKNRFPEIIEALKKGKAPVDYKVENALLKSALGYTVTVKEPVKLRTRMQKPGEGTIEKEVVEYVDREIYIKPDTTAQIFWLKNRRSDKWSDKHTVSASATGQLADLIDGLKEPPTMTIETTATMTIEGGEEDEQ